MLQWWIHAIVCLSKLIECTTLRLGPHVLCGLVWEWYVSVGSSCITSVLVQSGIFLEGEVVSVWGRGCMRNLCSSTQFCYEPKMTQRKESLFISRKKWNFQCLPSSHTRQLTQNLWESKVCISVYLKFPRWVHCAARVENCWYLSPVYEELPLALTLLFVLLTNIPESLPWWFLSFSLPWIIIMYCYI